jgi:pre-mRNA branch site protein p14
LQQRLPEQVNRVLFVKNLPFKITAEEMYDLFGKYGAIRQIRLYAAHLLSYRDWFAHRSSFFSFFRSGNKSETKGTAFVVYEDIFDAKTAQEHLSGFNVMGRYIVVLYHQETRVKKPATAAELAQRRADLEKTKAKFGIET